MAVKKFQCTPDEFKAEFEKFKFQKGDTIKIDRIDTAPSIYNYTVHYQETIKEEWAVIPNTKGLYEASTLGRIRRKLKHSHKVLKMHLVPETGYLQINFFIKGKALGGRVHRIIAKTFIKNPNNLPDVGFKNGIRTDVRPCNLFWKKENKKKSIKYIPPTIQK